MSDALPQPAPIPPSAPAAGRKPEAENTQGSIRETFESIIIAFVLAFVFRAFVVEAFVIPTGSMAPTLLGQHMQVVCPECGYRFTVGPRDYDPRLVDRVANPLQGVWSEYATRRGGQSERISSTRRLSMTCPMCEFPIDKTTLATSAGDRILVMKYIYAFPELHGPQRWDVVVFKNPEDPSINYIKRLVGLPGEQLWIVNGNIYTRPLTVGGGVDLKQPWRIQRKPERVQRAVWQPIFHSDYFPLDAGQDSRRPQAWTSPWQGREAGDWSFDDHARRWEHKADASGTLQFDFDHHDAFAQHVYAYNQFSGGTMYHRDPVEDLRIAATVQPRAAGAKVGLLLGSDGLMIRASIDGAGKVLVESARRGDSGQASGPWSPCVTGQVDPPQAGTPMRVELWHVDQSVSLWVNGRRVGDRWEYTPADVGVDFQSLVQGARNHPAPVAQMTVTGAATVHDVDLDRDLYYTQSGRRAVGESPITIDADRFFCCGDNSPESSDGRMWLRVDPWLEALTQVPEGFVPRQMMLGRAFFVYFPAPQSLEPLGLAFIPNFGKMRFIH